MHNADETDQAEIYADAMLSRMDNAQLAAQVMMIGYLGDRPTPDIIRWISEKNVGGIKIFGWNTDNIPLLEQSVNLMQEAAGKTDLAIPLFIATDQEGGWVRHVKGHSSITPGNMALGASEVVNDSYMTGYYIGMELKAVGINMNFAPTVDILINRDAHVVGPRAFSDDPLQTAVLATSYANGMKEAGIICTAKHFPGHGRTSDDSHGRLPVIDTKLDELLQTDLLPYKFLIKEDLPSIMSGHLAFPNITGDNTPASMSSVLLKKVLRERMNFDGIIITDDMQMNGASYKNDITKSCLEALKAGNDIVMLSRGITEYKMIRELVIKEMETDLEFEKQIKESVKRILKVKYNYLVKKQTSQPSLTVPAAGAQPFFEQQAFRSVSLINLDKEINTPERNEKVLLAGPFRLFFEEGLKRFPWAHTYRVPYSPFYEATALNIANLKAAISGYDTIIFCTANPAGIQMLDSLKNTNKKIIALSVLSPSTLPEFEWLDSGVAVYGTGRESFTAGFAAIAGDFAPEGKLPLGIKSSEVYP